MKLSEIEDKNNTLSKITNKEIFDLCTRIQSLAKVSCADFTIATTSVVVHPRVLGTLTMMMSEEMEREPLEGLDVYSLLIEHEGMIVRIYCVVFTK